MKKKIFIAVLSLILLISFFANRNVICLDGACYGILVYSYGDIYIWEELYGKDVDDLLSILNGKREHTDHPACGFSEDISITISGNTFALACDSCGVVKNCTTGKYVYISDTERDVLEAMFTSRGGKFPCV
jgi:hypothetical protein